MLIDLWGKLNRPRSVYSDLTWMGFVGKEVPADYAEIFRIVAAARDAAIAQIRDAFPNRRPLQGWQVDQAARAVIDKAGYGQYFCHRIGHSIGQEVHGNGANMDNLETHEERRVLPRTCFSVEPGIYLPEFGVRSEVNVFVDAQENVHVTGGTPQTQVLAITLLMKREGRTRNGSSELRQLRSTAYARASRCALPSVRQHGQKEHSSGSRFSDGRGEQR